MSQLTPTPARTPVRTARPAAEPAVQRDGRAAATARPAGARRWDARIRPALPRWVEAGLSVALFAVLAAYDLSAGLHADLAVLYLLPICMAAWSQGLGFGLLLAVAAIFTSHMTDAERNSAGQFPDSFVLFQDAAHAVIYLAAGGITWWVKRQGDRLADERQRAIEARARIEADLEAAHRVQQSLMVQGLPPVPRLEMAMGYRSARQVGGDLVDVQRRGVRLAICVADVSGKGTQAALLAVAVKGWLDSAPNRFVSPTDVVAHLNRRLCDCVPTDMFVTVVYVVLNTMTGEARCAVAGHEPPLVWDRQEGASVKVGPTGPSLGILPNATFDEVSWTLGDSDLLLLYTDGLTTARLPGGSRTGLDPTLARLRRFEGADLQPLVDDLLASAAPAGGVPDDDVALLALRRTGEG